MNAVTGNGRKPADGLASRDADGRFLPGGPSGPGRPKGSQNGATVDARVIKRRILECWDRIDGDKLLDNWARQNFGEFLKVVARLLPKQLDVEADPDPQAADYTMLNGTDLVRMAKLRIRLIDEEVDGFLKMHPDATEPPDYWGLVKVADFRAKRGESARDWHKPGSARRGFFDGPTPRARAQDRDAHAQRASPGPTGPLQP